MGKKVVPPTEHKFAAIMGKCAICGKTTELAKAGEIGATCKAHEGKIGKYYKPMPKNANLEGEYCKLSLLCRRAEQVSKTAGFVVSLTGGDGGTRPPIYAWAQVYVLVHGNVVRKFLKIEAKAELEKLLTNKVGGES